MPSFQLIVLWEPLGAKNPETLCLSHCVTFGIFVDSAKKTKRGKNHVFCDWLLVTKCPRTQGFFIFDLFVGQCHVA